MINKIKSKFQTQERRALLSNFLSLSSLQIFNYIIPLITIPYLFQVLGSEKFGLVMFAQALIIYFGLIINYGFNLSATRQISINRDDIDKLSTIYSSILTYKILASIIIFFIFYFIINYFDKFSNESTLYLLSYGMLIESILFPVWFYQGMERMKFITIIYATSKILVLILIFLFIKSADDYEKVPLLYILGSLTSGFISIYISIKIFKIKIFIPKLSDIKFQLVDGWHLFISNLSINMYRNANILILGFLTSPVFVGYYALAEKVIKAVQGVLGPVSESLYPYIAKKSNQESSMKSISTLFKLLKYYLIILSILFISIIVLSPMISKLLAGQYDDNVINNLRILSFVVLFGGLNYLIGIIGLINLGYKKYFTKATLISGTFNVVVCFVLSYYLQDIGAAISLSLTEIVLFIILFSKIRKIKKTGEISG